MPEFPTVKPVEGLGKRPAKSVLLPENIWLELDEIAKFQTDALCGPGQRPISRNAVITQFLQWSINKFWSGLGGRPDGNGDRSRKIRKYAVSMMEVRENKKTS